MIFLFIYEHLFLPSFSVTLLILYEIFANDLNPLTNFCAYEHFCRIFCGYELFPHAIFMPYDLLTFDRDLLQYFSLANIRPYELQRVSLMIFRSLHPVRSFCFCLRTLCNVHTNIIDTTYCPDTVPVAHPSFSRLLSRPSTYCSGMFEKH